MAAAVKWSGKLQLVDPQMRRCVNSLSRTPIREANYLLVTIQCYYAQLQESSFLWVKADHIQNAIRLNEAGPSFMVSLLLQGGLMVIPVVGTSRCNHYLISIIIPR